jgi:hypothetical protein
MPLCNIIPYSDVLYIYSSHQSLDLYGISKERRIITLLSLLPFHLITIILPGDISLIEDDVTTRVLAAEIGCHEGGKNEGHEDHDDEDTMTFDKSGHS